MLCLVMQTLFAGFVIELFAVHEPISPFRYLKAFIGISKVFI